MDQLYLYLFILISYLTGSFPSAVLIGKFFYKKDVREFGSGNAEEFLDFLLVEKFKLHDLRWHEKIIPITKDKMMNLYNEENKKGGFMLCIPKNSKVII